MELSKRLLLFILLTYVMISCMNMKKLQLKSLKKCKNFKLEIPNFDLDAALGVWYPVSKTTELPIFTSCDTITLSKAEDKGILGEVKNRKNDSNAPLKITLTASVKPNSYSFKHKDMENLLTIIDTDYKNWAVVYICTDINVKIYNALLLSRVLNTPKEQLDKMKAIILDKTKLKSDLDLVQAPGICPA